MKQYLPIILVLSFLGCARHPSNAAIYKPLKASIKDCDRLYAHSIALTIATQFDPDHEYDALHLKVATELIDQEFRDNGTTGRFYSFCSNKMTKEQVACGMASRSNREVQMCSLP
jgi:hypothetical protein